MVIIIRPLHLDVALFPVSKSAQGIRSDGAAVDITLAALHHHIKNGKSVIFRKDPQHFLTGFLIFGKDFIIPTCITQFCYG